MIEKQVTGIKFDIDRKEQKTNVMHNEIPNCQNENWCKTEKLTCFYKEQHVIKRIQHFLGKQDHDNKIIRFWQ